MKSGSGTDDGERFGPDLTRRPNPLEAREMAAHGIAREPIGDTPASQW